MKREKLHYSERGLWSASGASKSAAKASLDAMLDWYCAQPFPVIESRFGLTLVILPSPVGWQIEVFDASKMNHAARRHCSTQTGQTSFADALDSARIHAAQNAWRAELADDSAFIVSADLSPSKAAELARWIRFQRAYIEFKADGYQPGDCHRLACEASYIGARAQ